MSNADFRFNDYGSIIPNKATNITQAGLPYTCPGDTVGIWIDNAANVTVTYVNGGGSTTRNCPAGTYWVGQFASIDSEDSGSNRFEIQQLTYKHT